MTATFPDSGSECVYPSLGCCRLVSSTCGFASSGQVLPQMMRASSLTVAAIRGHIVRDTWNAAFQSAIASYRRRRIFKRDPATGKRDGLIRCFEASAARQTPGVRPMGFHRHTDAVNMLAISSCGRRLASVSSDKKVKLWDTLNVNLIRDVGSHDDAVTCVDFASDDVVLATGSMDQSIRLWDSLRGELLQQLYGHTDGVLCLLFQKSSGLLWSSSYDKSVALWRGEFSAFLT